MWTWLLAYRPTAKSQYPSPFASKAVKWMGSGGDDGSPGVMVTVGVTESPFAPPRNTSSESLAAPATTRPLIITSAYPSPSTSPAPATAGLSALFGMGSTADGSAARPDGPPW